MKNLIILCGIPGSGKSTWANSQKNVKVVSRDDIRMKFIKDDEDYFSHETEVFAEFIAQIKGAIYSRDISYDAVIADATHLNYFSRKKLLSRLFDDSEIDENNLKDLPIIFMFFHESLDTCLARNAKRTGRKRVPDETIIDMYEHLTEPPDCLYCPGF